MPAGLKRHSVTLFEGGRVAGEAVMAELLDELWQSYEAGQVSRRGGGGGGGAGCEEARGWWVVVASRYKQLQNGLSSSRQ